MSRRIERINALLQQEIGVILSREIQDPRLGAMVSVTEVDTSPDLRNAIVKVSILGSTEEVKEALAGLRHASGYLRHELAVRLSLRQVPELSFRLDRSIEEGARILELLREIKSEEGE